MPRIGVGGVTRGKTYAVGFWDSQTCDNSLASFPSGIDFSWGNLELTVGNVDSDNYVEVKVLSTTQGILKTFKYTTKGTKIIDLSQFNEITSTQDVKIRIEITALT